MDLFLRLVLGHLLADFTFQTNRLAGWKRESLFGMMIHAITHPLVMILVSWPYMTQVWYTTQSFSLLGWQCVLGIFFLHWAQDEFRVWLILSKGWKDSTFLFVVDQVLHLLTLYWMIPAGLWQSAPLQSPQWVMGVMAFVIATHFLSVVIHFLELDLDGNSVVLRNHKYSYMLERVVAIGLFCIPQVGIGVGGVSWMGWLAWTHRKSLLPRTPIHIFLSTLAVLFISMALKQL